MSAGWIAFDLNGTLVDPAGLLPGEDPELGRGALDDAVLLAMAETLAGGHRPLAEHLTAALRRRLANAGLDPAPAAEAAQRTSQLPPQPGAREALARLAAAGLRVAVVTNSAAGSARETLAGAGLDAHVEAVVGIDGVGAFKPDPRVYRNAERALGASPGELTLVAAHAWDVLGAKAAGWRTAWVAHRERQLAGTVPEPDVRAATLLEAAAALA